MLIKISEALWHHQDTLDQMTLMINLHVDGLVHDFSNSSAIAMELLQSCTKPLISIFWWNFAHDYKVASIVMLILDRTPFSFFRHG